jgi:hypothetical protein
MSVFYYKKNECVLAVFSVKNKEKLVCARARVCVNGLLCKLSSYGALFSSLFDQGRKK